ncbi:mCG147633, partial [Mus musculus]
MYISMVSSINMAHRINMVSSVTTDHGHLHGPQWQYRSWTSTWSPAATRPLTSAQLQNKSPDLIYLMKITKQFCYSPVAKYILLQFY